MTPDQQALIERANRIAAELYYEAETSGSPLAHGRAKNVSALAAELKRAAEANARLIALVHEADGFYSAHADMMNLVCGLAAELRRTLRERDALRDRLAKCEPVIASCGLSDAKIHADDGPMRVSKVVRVAQETLAHRAEQK